MKNISRLFKIALVAIFATTTISCNNDDDNAAQSNTIAAVASRNANLTSLVAALQRADLVETLDQTGPYTVFAPTNAAFADFLDDNGFATLNDVPVALLREVLLNHVISGTTLSSGLTTGYIKTLGKGSASATNTLSMYVNTAAGVRLNGVSSVIIADVAASNGVVHVVDAVIGLPTVVTHAAANPNFTTLVSLLSAQNLVDTLDGTESSPFTVFAPLNSAFNQATLDLYTSLADADKTAVLTYHVVTGANVLSNAIPTTAITTFQGGTFTIAGTVITDESDRDTNIVLTDVQASNGIIHAVDQVLLPVIN